MASKLENLITNLVEPHKKLLVDILKQRFPNTYRLCDDDNDKFKLFLKKRVYLYEYMDSWEKFELPVPVDKNLYYSKINDSNISDEDLNRVNNVCNTFKRTNLGNIMIRDIN